MKGVFEVMGDARGTSGQGPADAPDGVGPDMIEPYLIKDPEAFARNLARMLEELGKAASAWVEPRESGERTDTVSEPLTDIVKTFSRVIEYWLADPSRAFQAQTHLMTSYFTLWHASMRRLSGDEAAPLPKAAKHAADKRFKDSDWDRHAIFEFLRAAYWVTSDWAEKMVADTGGLDDRTRQKAAFYTRQIVDALAPSNFVMTNPELYRETVAANGENLVRGMRMLAEDIAAGKGELKLRQSDAKAFEVGGNLATTPGKVIAENELCQIIQYAPTTEKVLRRPLLICPPWINKFYILDLSDKKSFIAWAAAQGHTVFVISWVNPDNRHKDKDWEAYIREGLEFALETVEKATGERTVNTIGYCVGGTLLAAAMAYHAQTGDKRIASATLMTAQVDFTHAGDLKVFADAEQVQALEESMERTGYLEGSKMASAFNMLRSSELIWPYVVNNYLKGKEPMPFDLLYWNSDSTRMSAANHSFYLRNCYLENNLSAGRMSLGGKRLSLKDVRVPVFNLATRDDHIAPAKSAYIGSQFFGGDVTFVLAGSGHIAGVINHPEKNKYQYWTGGPPVGALEDWVADAEEHPGSWWPHWHKWITNLEGMQETVDAKTREPGGGKLKPIEDAPGSYVRIKA